MLAPLSTDSLPPLNPCNRARPERTPLLQEGASPPLPGHSPGWLSALFLALWKGLFFFFPGKGNIAQPSSGSPQTPSLTRTDGAPLSSRDPLPWPCPDPSLLGHQKPPPLPGSLPRSSGSSWAQRVCRVGGWGEERPGLLPTPSLWGWGRGGGLSSLLHQWDRPTGTDGRFMRLHFLELPVFPEWVSCSYLGGRSSQFCKKG